MENNHSMSRVERSRREKVTRYSVRKVSFGAASVAVAAFFMFLGNGAVYAAEPNVTATDSALAATPANNQLDENSGSSEATASKAQADTTTPTPADASSTSVESATVSKAQADTTTSKPADATPAPVVSSTTSTTEEKLAEKNTEASSAEANSVENKEQTTVKAEEPSTTSVATTKSAEETATTESHKPKSRKKRAVDATSVETVAATSSNENDPLAKNRQNTGQIINGNFSDTSKGATIPTEGPRNAANTYSAVSEDQMVGWKLDKTDGNTSRFDLVWGPNALPAYNYLTFGKTSNKVGANLGLYTNHNFYGGKRKNGSGPIYQDISVTPGGEAVIQFVGSSVWNANGYNGVQVTVADASNPGDILYKGSPFLNEAKYGVFRGILNIPANVSKIRLTFSSTVNSSFDTANMSNHLIPNEWGSSVVGDVKVSSGSFVTSSVNNIAYTETATSSSAKVVDSTVSATLKNEGYGDAMDAEYKVVLPKGAVYKSGTNVKSHSFDEASRTLTLKIGEVKKDQPVNFDYTITLPADKPSRETLTGHVTYHTKGFSMNEKSLSVNQAVVGGQEYGIRNEFIKTESTIKQGAVDIPAQTVTVKMYKNDLQTSVTQMEETLKTLNKDDYSTESWNSLQKALRDAKKVLSETDATPIEDRADQDAINNFPILLAKEKAKLDLDKVAREQKAAIETKNNATKEEKAEAKAKVEAALDKANSAVDAATTEADVVTIEEAQTSKITPIFPVEVSKDAAKVEIQKALELKNAEINSNDNLTTEEKTTALAEAKKKADEAKTLVDAATTDASVERAEISGTNKIESYSPAAKAKPEAKAAIDAALKAQEKAIDAKADSTTEEKEAAKEDARAKAEAAKEAIDKADSNANVAAAKDAGVGTITPVEPKAEVKPAARQAIEDAYTAKAAEIEKRPELTTEEKTAAKAEARKLADAAKANVDKAKT
ncbi:SasC/FmtB family protein, partial [Streptococcus mitis]|uniref:SasC/FmtB family protein n=1 Tax=Streptococcus mitis TaxID=28037 RepID=UPI0021B7D2FE